MNKPGPIRANGCQAIYRGMLQEKNQSVKLIQEGKGKQTKLEALGMQHKTAEGTGKTLNHQSSLGEWKLMQMNVGRLKLYS